jgi:hypothetical protein
VFPDLPLEEWNRNVETLSDKTRKALLEYQIRVRRTHNAQHTTSTPTYHARYFPVNPPPPPVSDPCLYLVLSCVYACGLCVLYVL